MRSRIWLVGLAAVLSILIAAFALTACGGGGGVSSLEKKKDVHALVVSLRSDDVKARQEAALALGRLHARGAVPALIRTLAAPGSKPQVIRALVQIGDRRAVSPLLAIIDQRSGLRVWKKLDAGTRSTLVWWFGRIQEPKAVDPLLRLERCPKCRTAILRIGKRAVYPLLGELRAPGSTSDAAADMLVRIGKPAVPGVIAALRYKDADVGTAAATVLGRIRDRTAVPSLIKAMDAGDKEVRAEAARALGQIGDMRAVAPLEAKLTSDIAYAAAPAVVHLSRKDPHRLVPLLSDSSTVFVYSDIIDQNLRGIDDHLVAALQALGNETMAEDYLNYGNATLVAAARAWATAHGYTITTIKLG